MQILACGRRMCAMIKTLNNNIGLWPQNAHINRLQTCASAFTPPVRTQLHQCLSCRRTLPAELHMTDSERPRRALGTRIEDMYTQTECQGFRQRTGSDLHAHYTSNIEHRQRFEYPLSRTQNTFPSCNPLCLVPQTPC